MAIVRIILGIVIGVALGMGAVIVGDIVNHQLFPPPPPEQLQDYLATAPIVALIGLPIAYSLAALVAAFAGAKIAGKVWPGWVAGGVLVAGTIANLVMITHPLWMTIACAVFVPLAAFLGARWGAPKIAS